jgi:ferredoxin
MTTNRKLLLCNCNRTMSVDAKAVARGLDLEHVPAVATGLCRAQVSTFEGACKSGDDLLVACTQEAPLFSELHSEWKATGEIRFVNIREHAGWSQEGRDAAPKMAALLAIADQAPPEPVGVVSYRSSGEMLIIGPAQAALEWAERLAHGLSVSVLLTDSRPIAAPTARPELPTERKYPVYSGGAIKLRGHLGAFDVSWEQANPIDLDLCTRCGACVKTCPEQAIDFTFQVDMSRCTSHRLCVSACAPGAIDFARNSRSREDRYDLVLDLSPQPLLTTVQPPQGYLAPGPDPLQQALAASTLERLVGEFEKPRFYTYNEKLCAHARSGIVACTQCIDVCSTAAITSDLENSRVHVDPHLCMGCGGCATVCPSGAMTYAYPRMADIGARLRAALGAYRKAGGATPCVLFHGPDEAKALLARLARRGRGLPAHVIPVEVMHPASIGPDLLLGALALGASQTIVLSAGTEPAQYREAISREVELCNTVVRALGYAGTRTALLVSADAVALEQAVWSLDRLEAVPAATFNLSNEKRRTLDFVLDHLVRHAPSAPEVIALEAGAPFGEVRVDRAKCTLCLACVGACPENALLDAKDAPQLRFIERNCVQCGLCAKTCPEGAITLSPRLLLGSAAKSARVLNETEPFNCVRCAKAFGTRQMIDTMLGRLSGHAMFGTPAALRRLQMCADCRVLDMMDDGAGASIFDYAPGAAKIEP